MNYRRTSIALFAAGLLLVAQAGAQGIIYKATGAIAPAARGDDGPAARPRASLQRKIFLLGSVHYGRADMYPLSANVYRAFEQAQAMLVEIDIAKADMSEVGRMMADRGYYPPGDSLQRRLQPAQWLRLTTVLGRFGLNQQLISRMRPWMAAITMVDVLAREQGLSAERGIDLYLLRRAHARAMTVIALESFQSQLKIFWRLDPDEQLGYLLSELDKVEENEQVLADLIEKWKAGDADGIDGLLIQTIRGRGFESLYKTLIVERNAQMLQSVLRHAQDHESLLVVVGVGHVVGDAGLAEGLRSAGFSVQEMR